MKDKVKGFVYFISNGEAIKIGFSKNPVEKRLKQLQTGSSLKLSLVYSIEGVTMDFEKTLHNYFGSQYNKRGEFYESEAVMRWINQYKLNIEAQISEGII